VPRLGRKLVWTTLITCVVFGVVYAVYTDQLITMDQILKPLGLQFNEKY
jgi:predicted secreted protein